MSSSMLGIFSQSVAGSQVPTFQITQQGVGIEVTGLSATLAAADYIVYDWRIGGSSIARINMAIAESGNNASTTGKDYSSNATGATKINTPSFNVSGVESNSGRFLNTGTNEGYHFGNVTDLNSISKMSVLMWVKRTGASAFDTMFSKYSNNSNRVQLVTLSATPTEWLLLVCNGSDARAQSNTAPLALNQWAMIVGTFDGTQTGNANRAKQYSNGVLETSTFTGTIPATTPSIATNVSVGVRSDNSQGFLGQVDCAMVFTGRTLTQDQITLFYNGGVPQFNKIATAELTSGTWSCRATPITAGVAGTPVDSNSIVIV